MKIKHAFLCYIAVLALWMFSSYFFSSWSPEQDSLFYLCCTVGFGLIGYIAIKIMAGNKRRPSLIFVKLSSLPILIITTHIILMIHGRPFTEQGGWWVLYALLILGLPISVILLIIGLIRMKFKEAKVKNG